MAQVLLKRGDSLGLMHEDSIEIKGEGFTINGGTHTPALAIGDVIVSYGPDEIPGIIEILKAQLAEHAN